LFGTISARAGAVSPRPHTVLVLSPAAPTFPRTGGGLKEQLHWLGAGAAGAGHQAPSCRTTRFTSVGMLNPTRTKSQGKSCYVTLSVNLETRVRTHAHTQKHSVYRLGVHDFLPVLWPVVDIQRIQRIFPHFPPLLVQARHPGHIAVSRRLAFVLLQQGTGFVLSLLLPAWCIL